MYINTDINPVALHAARAARQWHAWGAFAARRYAERRGVPSGLLTLARVLANAEKGLIATQGAGL